ncbi:RNA polymerase sigma factor [Rathayibacter sp. VKM Ac-2929]|uniref:RNA polymerase sigma factor n=1 Tax=Rathayibacter sp. VKM Ac-2929 TaxID=2929480 RepID=UPI001FB35A8A|nr:RNA polymerase sigma factor [Rathayibacter sp. VKM Ac-2929]MCJ1675753.1 RNA polymerase sigma factor [Rathayibacter sp. VKM Ac-2929]
MLTTARTSTRATAPAVFDATTLPALPMDSDRVLVIRAASGDDRAFAAIVNRYSRLLRAIASRTLGSSADVDDVVQETFLAAWTHLDSVIDGETIAGWLATTTRRRSIDRLRAPASARRTELDEELPAPEQDDPEAAGRCTALAADAQRVLERMPALQRRCWELRQLHELSYDEIALDLDTTPTAVRGMLSRARLLMASELAHWR